MPHQEENIHKEIIVIRQILSMESVTEMRNSVEGLNCSYKLAEKSNQ